MNCQHCQHPIPKYHLIFVRELFQCPYCQGYHLVKREGEVFLRSILAIAWFVIWSFLAAVVLDSSPCLAIFGFVGMFLVFGFLAATLNENTFILTALESKKEQEKS